MNSNANEGPKTSREAAFVVVAHVLLTAVLGVLSLVFIGPGPSIVSILFQGLLTAQACLLAIWFALSPISVGLRVAGIGVGMGGLIFLSTLAANPRGFPRAEQFGLRTELLIVPAIGVAVVMLMLPVMVPKSRTVDPSIADAKPRFTLLGLLTIISVVAVLLALPPAVQYFAGYDRISVYIVAQTIALSVVAYAAVWTALSGGSPWPRMAVFAGALIGAALFIGRYAGSVFQLSFGLLHALTIFFAAIIVLSSLLVIRHAGVRCRWSGGSARRVLLRASSATLVVSVGIGVLDFIYGRSVFDAPSKPYAAQTTIDDPSGEKRVAAMQEFTRNPSAEALTLLLRLNGDGTTVVDELAGRTGGTGTYQAIESNGHDYIAAIGRRSGKQKPPGLREQIAFGSSSDWMARYSTACFLNGDGQLLGKLGGKLASDKVNGDDVWLTTLGTKDRWFAKVMTFEPHGRFTYQTEICLIEPGFPTAFLIHHFPNSMAWTDTPEQAEGGSYFVLDGLPSGGRLPRGAKGLGTEGKVHAPKITWDNDRGVFSGPAKLTYNGQPCFEIDLNRSMRFRPIDHGSEEAPR